jgi:hypothetical protein
VIEFEEWLRMRVHKSCFIECRMAMSSLPNPTARSQPLPTPWHHEWNLRRNKTKLCACLELNWTFRRTRTIQRTAKEMTEYNYKDKNLMFSFILTWVARAERNRFHIFTFSDNFSTISFSPGMINSAKLWKVNLQQSRLGLLLYAPSFWVRAQAKRKLWVINQFLELSCGTSNYAHFSTCFPLSLVFGY